KTGKEIKTFKGKTDPNYSVKFSADSVHHITFSPDGRLLVSGSYDSRIHIWDVTTGLELHTLSEINFPASWVAFSPDGNVLLSGGRDTSITLWSPDSGQKLASLIIFNDDNWAVITPNG